MSVEMSLAELQQQFGAHLRDPENNPAPLAVDGRRMGVYRELIFNNIESLLANIFPVINNVLAEDIWMGLIREFLRDYRATTPYFPCLGQELIQFLADRQDNSDLPDFILELAHYENIEFDIMLTDEEFPLSAKPTELNATSQLTLASTAFPLAYRYPVHTIRVDQQPEVAPDQPTFLLVFQDISGDVRFFELQGLTYHLLQFLKENRTQTLQDLLTNLAQTVRQNDAGFVLDDETFIMHGINSLQQFNDLCVLRDSCLLGE